MYYKVDLEIDYKGIGWIFNLATSKEGAMGKFFTALHVKIAGKEQFIEKFTRLMKKDGYVPCGEDEAEISYAAAFSENGVMLPKCTKVDITHCA